LFLRNPKRKTATHFSWNCAREILPSRGITGTG
jgi:hypothetical protein